MSGTDKYGFPIRHRTRRKLHFGFQTGDMVRAHVPAGKHRGVFVGRVLCRASGCFDIRTNNRRGVSQASPTDIVDRSIERTATVMRRSCRKDSALLLTPKGGGFRAESFR
jgi:hypothetical protein